MSLSRGWVGIEQYERACLEMQWPREGPAYCHSPEHIHGSSQCCTLAHLSLRYNCFFSIHLNCSQALVKCCLLCRYCLDFLAFPVSPFSESEKLPRMLGLKGPPSYRCAGGKPGIHLCEVCRTWLSPILHGLIVLCGLGLLPQLYLAFSEGATVTHFFCIFHKNSL